MPGVVNLTLFQMVKMVYRLNDHITYLQFPDRKLQPKIV